MTKISVTILCKNSQKHIREVLSALQWCDEVILLDSGSTDDTLNIAVEFANTSIYRHEGIFAGFGIMHQKAEKLAKNDWVLSIDSDEIVSPELKNEILNARLDSHTVYAIPFHNYFNGRHIKSCGWHPDYKLRLYDKRQTGFCDSTVHENVKTQGLKIVRLQNFAKHYSYDTISDFLSKMQSYSTLFAAQYAGKKSSSPSKAVAHGAWAFVKNYLLKKGITEGYEGFAVSVYNAQTAFWKYMKLYEANCTIQNGNIENKR